MILSILVPTTSKRATVFAKLHLDIKRQIKDKPVELLINANETDNIGKKRNDLLSEAKGEWVVFVDDDDWIAPDYVSKILSALKSNPDCVGISGWMTTNGKKYRQWHISKEYGSWYQEGGVYYRTTNHISPVRRSLAIQAGFPEKSYGEDFDFSSRLLPLLKTEAKVHGNIYHYKFISHK